MLPSFFSFEVETLKKSLIKPRHRTINHHFLTSLDNFAWNHHYLPSSSFLALSSAYERYIDWVKNQDIVETNYENTLNELSQRGLLK